MTRKDDSPKHKLQRTFHLLKSIWRKRRLFLTVKGMKICRLNFRRSHRLPGPFLGRSGNYRSPVTDNIPIGHQTKWTAFLCFLFVSLFLLFCFVFELGPTLSLFIFWLGPEKLRDFKFGKRPPGVGSCLSLYSERERGERIREERKKNATDALLVFERQNNTCLNNNEFWVVALSMKVQLDLCL